MVTYYYYPNQLSLHLPMTVGLFSVLTFDPLGCSGSTARWQGVHTKLIDLKSVGAKFAIAFTVITIHVNDGHQYDHITEPLKPLAPVALCLSAISVF